MAMGLIQSKRDFALSSPQQTVIFIDGISKFSELSVGFCEFSKGTIKLSIARNLLPERKRLV